MKKYDNYSVICTINDHVVLSWRFRTITQVCRFISEIDDNYLRISVFRDSPFKELDSNSLLELWRGNKE